MAHQPYIPVEKKAIGANGDDLNSSNEDKKDSALKESLVRKLRL
eukprot:CAMPEP_0114599044 /NCGR_PEP_ID=MMETSP0125-20121206/21482_1 /TAXON_ID=485358 ORGANISM="Aristerostoma sp., Strain ATCC 50986" /NCGR_SAMPLE_ID=MMETSP0125 /ASSEMBLY_ACC=CAM_ASM_000245 /LENGTH=43 /DNA_ID= /DNA_START= /DNA_END= /DNA_ORIENTATION=